jgi:hypothetical protein
MHAPGAAPRDSRARLVAAAILAVGWIAALGVYATATPVEEDAQIADMEYSKAYEHRVEVVGGKAALEAERAQAWLESLWQGQRLAYTTAALTALVALGYWAVARGPGPRRDPEE